MNVRILELFCGRGGWTAAARRAGVTDCVGIDITQHGYPGKLVTRSLPADIADLIRPGETIICGSPPCEDYARRHLPWIRTIGPIDERPLRWATTLEASKCPYIIECNRYAGWHVPGGRYVRPWTLWGNVPPLMPQIRFSKDAARGHSKQLPGVRASRAAEIPGELADHCIHWLLTMLRKGQETDHGN